ncbi:MULTISPECIES: hypothetical protein [unclassified Janthinobacterium]|uniref:hypothetical protein n=1 Tax=unclassified Janthinobacterium TaxID=2610881 RepID=UPI0018CBAADA|nr:hypothetical protein [Janthinobacterium sp. CG_23.4]
MGDWIFLHDLWARCNRHSGTSDWAVSDLRPVAVAGNADDFLIWHQALPHCATANHGPSTRMVQYPLYFPEHCQDQDAWI